MTRYDIINLLIEKNNYECYLEIGYQDGICYENIKIKDKNAVDPFPRKKEDTLLVMTSDDFFKFNKKKYDVIFIDGLHTYEQVKRDFENSLNSLNSGGVIVFHDMNPEDVIFNGYLISGEERSKSFNDGGQWNGDCFKLAIDIYNGNYEYEYLTVNSDQGCMIVFPESKRIFTNNNIPKDYNSLNSNRQEILNLISIEDFKNL